MYFLCFGESMVLQYVCTYVLTVSVSSSGALINPDPKLMVYKYAYII